MKRKAYTTILIFVALTVFGAISASAQDQHRLGLGDRKVSTQVSRKKQENLPINTLKIDTSAKMQEPHHVLAMAYRQTIRTFAQALLDQAQSNGALSADFARAAVTEMNRNFDSSEDHYKQHMKPTNSDARLMTASAIKEMDINRSRLKDAIDILEKGVENYTLNSKQIAIDSAEVIRHLDEISKIYNRQ